MKHWARLKVSKDRYQSEKIASAGVAQLGEQQTEVHMSSGGPVFNPRSWHFFSGSPPGPK